MSKLLLPSSFLCIDSTNSGTEEAAALGLVTLIGVGSSAQKKK